LSSPDSPSRIQEVFLAGTEPTSSCTEDVIAETAPEETSDIQEPQDLSTSDTEAGSRDQDEVTLEVCAISGLLASADCPRTEKKTFQLGKEPVLKCSPEFHRNEADTSHQRTERDIDRQMSAQPDAESSSKPNHSRNINADRPKSGYGKDGAMH
jgi:hypothetical protein